MAHIPIGPDVDVFPFGTYYGSESYHSISSDGWVSCPIDLGNWDAQVVWNPRTGCYTLHYMELSRSVAGAHPKFIRKGVASQNVIPYIDTDVVDRRILELKTEIAKREAEIASLTKLIVK